MGFFSKTKTIATHNGKFHADDIFAVAALRMAAGGSVRIVRTRDPEVIAKADYVADVGGIHDPSLSRFDHHQHGGAGTRPNGIPYAAFGLVWKSLGEKISGSPEIAQRIDAKLAAPIDADDNGMLLVSSTSDTTPYGLQGILYAFRPTWKEDPKMYDDSFMQLVDLAEKVITREIRIARDGIEANTKVEAAYAASADKRLIVLDSWYPYQETLSAHPEPLYVVAPRAADSNWKVETVRVGAFGFENRKSLPAEWAGLRDADLAQVTGVADAIFCHNGRFLAVAKSKEGALELARRAVDSQ